MSTVFPSTLIQIHYHNRPAGVGRVMAHYAGAFQRLWGKDPGTCILMCHAQGTARMNGSTEIVSHSAFDYRAFRSKASFLKTKETLIRAIEKVISRPDLPKPVAVIGHNLTMGKNCALSAAFATLASTHAGSTQIRFYSVVHDMAEEGRATLLRNLHVLESAGVSVWKYIYPVENVQYVVLNKRNYRLFNKAGFPVSMLPDPLENVSAYPKLAARQRAALHDGLRSLARKDGCRYQPDAATLFYPVRVIARKNVLEAIILACLMHKANLLIGAGGTSSQDRALFRRIRKLAQSYNIPVLFDVERLEKFLPAGMLRNRSLFSLLYEYCDCCVTTSIGEGFGYAVYEPWLYNKKVIGRLPMGIAADELHIDLHHLYTSLPVPVQWISLKRLYTCYSRQRVMAYGRKCSSLSIMQFRRMMVRSGCVDFGALHQDMQFDVFERLCRILLCGTARNAFHRGMPGRITDRFDILARQLRAISRTQTQMNRLQLGRVCVGKAFDEALWKCFTTAVKGQGRRVVDIEHFIKYFSSLKNFRLLMNPRQ